MTSQRKMLLGLAVFLFLGVLTFYVSTPDALALLKQKSSGADVLKLQQQLQTLGYLQHEPTGYFGEETQNAVLKLQKEHNLLTDGIVGSQTNYIINKLLGLSNNSLDREVLGFYVGDEPAIPSSYATVTKQKDTITSISPFWYRLDKNNPGQLEHYGSVTEQEINEVLNFTQNNNQKNYALIHNLLYGKTSIGKDVVHTTMSNPDTRWALVTNIFNLLQSKGFDGVCIDIENIYHADKDLFVQFLAELSAKLKPEGYKIIVCVPSKTSDNPNGSWGDNFDYPQIGNYADMVAVMAYDEHGSYSDPGPIASVDWVNQVVQYTLTKLSPEKVLLGVPGYGFDWNINQNTSRYLSYQIAMDTARQYQKSINWDSQNNVPFFNYYDNNGLKHSVYFENSSSLASKLDIVNNNNLCGIAIWRLGMEDPDSWRVISDKFTHNDLYNSK